MLGFTPLMTVVGTLALLKLMKRLVAASKWTRVTDQTRPPPPTQQRGPRWPPLAPAFVFIPPIQRFDVDGNLSASGHMTHV